MNNKLTLSLDKTVIAQAKAYANKHNQNLSRIIEAYLRALVSQEPEFKTSNIEISTFVESMAVGKQIPADLDLKKEVRKHLEEKYR